MGTLSIWHIMIVAIVAVLVFGGRGKISDLMGDVAKGIRSFRSGLNEPEFDRPAMVPVRRVTAEEKGLAVDK
jgi:sec-independent protein translocase protein TatA